ncbi:MAG TPA: transposase [Vicinamibacterales bacterium]|nr:transposase [Vicinamibacterales bacterium]
MPRPLRLWEPGISQHVYQRGHNGCTTFVDDSDCEVFVSLLRRASDRTNVDVHGFSIMKTHYHVVATSPTERALPRLIQILGGSYVRYFNGRYARYGTLWGGRYSAKLIRDERYWLTCLRYVECNALAAHVVANAEAHKWCSYRVHALGERSNWLVEHPLYKRLGKTPVERQAAYRAICGTVPEYSDTSEWSDPSDDPFEQ